MISQTIKWLSLFAFIVFFQNVNGQKNTDRGQAYIDSSGILRWEKTKAEVKGFGVNYAIPFAHGYRSALRMGIDPKAAIDSDVYHFSRLGFDLYRLHVWDTEISDTLGNIIENKHLDTFDYLLNQLKKHHINYVITPIAFWGNGWPEPDTDSPGFSHKYGKDKSLTEPGAIQAAENYLEQFLNHVNPYTRIAYKDDPNLIAFEVSNEPHHSGDAKAVTAYIKKMVSAMRKTGTKKPIFYNTSHGVHFEQAYFDGGIQGGTFQWYPTGLGYQRELPGNVLPNVNDYNIPFDSIFKKNHGAKIVYEFDAADVGRSYVYPAMARSFREAGIQIGTHFAYDPTFLAPYNTEYNTHYMNLVYTPQKALSLMITGKVFHESPMYADYGTYPENLTFGNVTVDYKKDLAEYNAAETFIYTNSTNTAPKKIKKLSQIAGYGNSPVIQYDGTGAYFLDKIDKNSWRLEVMPDALWVDNPFGKNSPKKIVGVLQWNTRNMTVKLPQLDSSFEISTLNEGNSFAAQVTGNTFTIAPGTYILSKTGSKQKWSPNDAFGTNTLKDFEAPKGNVNKPWLKHEPILEATANEPLEINIQFIAPTKPEQIQLIAQTQPQWTIVDFKQNEAFQYTATIPAEKMTTGYLNYAIVIKMDAENYMTYPAAVAGKPFDWDFYQNETYEVRVVPASNPLYLFNAKTDASKLVVQWRRGFKLVPTANFGEAEYVMHIEKLFVPDVENLNAKPIYDYSFKHFVLDKIKGREEGLTSKKRLVFKGRSLNDKPEALQIALVMDNGSSYGAIVNLNPETGEYALDLADLKPVKTVTLPRPYPSFLPYYFEHNNPANFDINRVESIQFSIGPNMPEAEHEKIHGIGIISVWLE